MKLNDIFNLNQYEEAYTFVSQNIGMTIIEIEPRLEKVEKTRQVEKIDEKGIPYIEEEKYIVSEYVKYYQIVEIPVYKPTNEEISQQRQNAYIKQTDLLTLRKLRKQTLGEWTTEDEKEYVAQIQTISSRIASDFPYNSEEPSLGAE